MNKPTLFFSHSSKDKDMVLAIKNKVMQYTSGTGHTNGIVAAKNSLQVLVIGNISIKHIDNLFLV